MRDNWEILGLEPTDDALAIKKAYARLLKKNRPDEQPDAYQALRQAYEWALSEAEWLRRAPQNEAEGGEAAAWPSETPHGEAEYVEPWQAGSAPEGLEAFGDFSFESEGAAALLGRWARRLLQCEPDDAGACWEDLAHELEALPLEEQGEASALFADFVLEHEALPSAVLGAMARYFRWGRDYRDAERLGAFRLAQLRERLIQDAPSALRDARQVEQATELLRLDWVLERQGKLSGWLYAALAGPGLSRLMAHTDDRRRRVLNISFLRWEAISTAARLAVFGRLLVVLVCTVALACLLLAPGQSLSDWVAAGGFIGFLCWYLAAGLSRWIPSADYMHSTFSALSWMRTDLERIIALNFLPLMLAGIARAAAELPALHAAYPVLGLVSAGLMTLTFSLLAWPEDEERQIFPAMLGIFAFALTGMTGTQGAGWVAALVVAAAWIGLGGWLYQQAHDRVVRFYRNPWGALRPNAWWGWALLVLASPVVVTVFGFLLVLALPVTLRMLARYMSANTVLLALGLAVALAILVEPASVAHAILPVLVLITGALTGLHAAANLVSRKLFSHVPATFFPHDD